MFKLLIFYFQTPHLVNLNEDATLSECLLYYIKEGVTKVGSPDSNQPQDIQLVGAHIQSEHCHFENSNGVVKLVPRPGAICFVNGRKVENNITLKTGSRVILGKNHVFRFNHPEQARELSAQGIKTRLKKEYTHDEIISVNAHGCALRVR